MKRPPTSRLAPRHAVSRLSAGTLLAAALAAPLAAQETYRVSVDQFGLEANGNSYAHDLSPDGRWTVYSSAATNLVPGDVNGVDDVFVHDRWTGAVEVVSVNSLGTQGNSTNTFGRITPDGRYVAFYAKSDNLVPGDTNFNSDVFVRDRALGITMRASEDASGVQGNGGSYQCAISADGRFVAFESDADNLVPGDTNGHQDIFLKDMVTGLIRRVSVGPGGLQADNGSRQVSISADGSRVAFSSSATNLTAAPDLNTGPDIYVYDVATSTTTLVHVDSAGNQGISPALTAAGPDSPSISADGTRVSFASPADNLVAGDGNGVADVFLHDMVSGQTVRVSESSAGVQADMTSRGSRISASGGQVLFESRATNLVAGDTNLESDVFLHDTVTGETERVSVSGTGTQASATCFHAGLSIDGRWCSFNTDSPNMVPMDFNLAQDVFLRDRGTTSTGDITLRGGGLVHTGSSVTVEWDGAPTTGAWTLLYSQNLNGTVVFGHQLDLGQPLTQAANGANHPSGSGTWSSGPLPPGAAGKSVFLELAARDQFSVIVDSNVLPLQIW